MSSPPDRRPSALVLDNGSGSGALAAIRALGAAGWRVGVGSPTPTPVIGRSRWVGRTHVVPWPEHGLGDFAASVAAALDGGPYDLVFGAGDDWVVALCEVAGQLDGRVAHPATATHALDKLRLQDLAAEAGIRSPRTVEATPDAAAGWRGDAVVKSREHWVPGQTDPSVRFEATYATTSEALIDAVETIRRGGGTPVLQQPIEAAELLAVTGLHDGERWRMVSQQRSTRVWPLPMGRSAAATTIPVDEDLRDRLSSLLTSLGLSGLVQVQLLRDRHGLWLIDVNPRFYGSLALQRAAGLDLAAAWAGWLIGRDVQPATARVGATYTWTEGVLRNAIASGDGSLIARLRVAVRELRRADVHPFRDRTDPAPAAAALLDLVRRTLSSLLRRATARS